MIDKHFFEQIFQNVEPESLLYEFLNSGDPLYRVEDKIEYPSPPGGGGAIFRVLLQGEIIWIVILWGEKIFRH